MSLPDLYEDEEFSWYRHKEALNISRHNGITFDVAKLVFSDLALVELGEDRRAIYNEQRYNVIGRSGTLLLFVTHSIRGALTHIISARLAEPYERRRFNRENEFDV
jgi:uncharacterized DUF497 family protein